MEVRTERGTARDVGTQFEVRIAGASLRVRVRSGLVEVHHADRSLQARAGTELMLVDGHATNRPLRGYGPDWDWAATVGPGLDIEGRALATFLDQLSREHGWTLRYADDDLARRASTIILHGSVHGLEAMEALETALGASGLEHRLNGGDLEVYRGSSSR
jgi:ferric-dicitrate binding protein FerR (iron transport regulator)